jgi:flagellar motor switch protein FliM
MQPNVPPENDTSSVGVNPLDKPKTTEPQDDPEKAETLVSKPRHAEIFDFKRPDRIAKSQLRAIYGLHESFARNLASSLSAYLRSYLTVNLVSVEQQSYGEFLERLAVPSCIVSLSLRPHDGNAIIEIGPSLIFPILEIILGGKGTAVTEISNREITEIEQQLLDTLFRVILNDLKEAWKAISAINFKIESIATVPQSLQILSPTEAVVALVFEVGIGDHIGSLNLAMPAINIKMIGQRFEQQWSSRKVVSSEADRSRMLGFVGEANVTLDTRLSGPRVALQHLLNLQIGDCLQFDYPVKRAIDCWMNGISKFQGRVVESNNRRAFLVEELPALPRTPAALES